jgi:hypothetical protein
MAGVLRPFPPYVERGRATVFPNARRATSAGAVVLALCALGRRPDTTYLLLATNNRKEPLRITFTLKGIDGLPETALEQIEYARVRLTNGRITDTLEPFTVRAYLIEPK